MTTPSPPLFILGAPRSGTSLLYKSLCLHPASFWISNYVHKWPAMPALGVLNRTLRSNPHTARRAWFDDTGNAYVYGRKRALLERLVPMPAEGETVFSRAGASEQPALRAPREEAVRNLRSEHRRLQRWAGGTTFVSKRIGHNRRVELLNAAFPDARFVHIVRDGRAVAMSLSQVDWWESLTIWWYGGTPQNWRDLGREPWELCAEHWLREVNSVVDGLQHVAADRVMDINYETLVADPIETLTAVAAFAGMARNEHWVENLRSLSYPNNNERWRSSLGAQELTLIESTQGAELARRGYV